MNLKSKKYPNIKYEKGQEIFLSGGNEFSLLF